MGWVPTYRNLTNVRVENGKFYSDETNGWFASMTSPGDSSNGLGRSKSHGRGLKKDEYGSLPRSSDLELEGAYSRMFALVTARKTIAFRTKVRAEGSCAMKSSHGMDTNSNPAEKWTHTFVLLHGTCRFMMTSLRFFD